MNNRIVYGIASILIGLIIFVLFIILCFTTLHGLGCTGVFIFAAFFVISGAIYIEEEL